jgi:aryl-phospho-beta-D-glucosidase BglC (GH1 family)
MDRILYLLRAALCCILLSLNTGDVFGSYLSARGAKLYNDRGEQVRLTGVNWFGFETTNMFPHGLWARDYHGVLIQVRNMGFNCIRIPFCNEMLRDDAKPDKPNFYGEDPYYLRDKSDLNKELAGLSPLEMLDEIIAFAKILGLVVILDNHSREHDGYMNEKVWYTPKISEEIWISDWVMLAKRFKNNPAVIGFDLENEPHGKMVDGGSTWAAGKIESDWNEAAEKCGNAILAENPDVLIIIEGVEQFESTVYWWGGNLRGVAKTPIKLTKPEKLVYSPHEYGPEVFQQPWFFESGFPGNMEKIWDDAFGFIVKKNIAPLFIGEFGISSLDSYEGKAGTWFKAFINYMAQNFYSWTFWALNPNSGDTGGILSNDWVTPVQWKLDNVKEFCAPLINEPMGTKKSPDNVKRSQVQSRIFNGLLTVYTGKKESGSLYLYRHDGVLMQKASGMSMRLDGVSCGVYTAVWKDTAGHSQTSAVVKK